MVVVAARSRRVERVAKDTSVTKVPVASSSDRSSCSLSFSLS